MTKEIVTAYFEGEGRPWMRECIHRAADWCLMDDIRIMVIFTGTGDGPHYAAKELLVQEKYSSLKVVAVTPPVGRPYRKVAGDPASPIVRAGLAPAMRDALAALDVGIVSAHLPFKEMYDGRDRTSEWTKVAEAFGVLGGGFSLCIQAALVSCDAGLIEHGQRVVALSADTAVVVRACRTECFLSPIEGLLVEHIICRPARYDLSRRFHETIAPPPASDVVDTTGSEAPAPQLAAPSLKRTGATKASPLKAARPRKTATKGKKRR